MRCIRLLITLALVVGALQAGEPAAERGPTLRDLNTHHLFTAPASRSAWEERRTALQQRLRFMMGLWPAPERTPLNARVTGIVEGPDYIVENIVLTTRPGVYLCGNLYRPKTGRGPFPAIVNPHGHWERGRLHQEEDVPEAPPGAPKPAPGKANLTAIGVDLARAGMVCFSYDMLGYADTQQMKHRTFTKDDLGAWQWSVSLLGLQAWNSVRVVDYLESRTDVDRQRIGATGASGGGSQTFLLAAADERIAASVPVNMVSSYMQGGCLCENAPGLRLGTDNAELAALMAPRPQLLVSCTGDWTKNVPQEEFPRIREVYALYGKVERIESVQFHFQHNYNRHSREAMLNFFRRVFLNQNDTVQEQPFTLAPDALRVWRGSEVPPPADALNEAGLRAAMLTESAEAVQRALTAAAHSGRASGELRLALRQALGLEPALPAAEAAAAAALPLSGATGGPRALLVSVRGAEQSETDARKSLEDRGYAVRTLRLEPIAVTAQQQLEKFFCCYNRTPLGERVARIEQALAAEPERPALLVGCGAAGPWSVLAAAISAPRRAPARLLADLQNLERLDAEEHPAHYAPGLRRAGDLRAALLLSAGQPAALLNAPPALIEPLRALLPEKQRAHLRTSDTISSALDTLQR